MSSTNKGDVSVEYTRFKSGVQIFAHPSLHYKLYDKQQFVYKKQT